MRLVAFIAVMSVSFGADFDFFEKKIRPVLAEKCYGCHSAAAKNPMGGLMVDSGAGLQHGGASGQSAVIPNSPEKSLLLAAIKREGKLKMPPGAALAPEVVADFETWIKMGAPDPRPEVLPPPAYNFEEARKFWSFQPVQEPVVPKVRDAAWSKNAIDRFIKAKLDEKKLAPVGLASKRALLRRATFDLTGLPPTPEEMSAFLADQSPKAFEKVVDRLLATRAYGEKWGRHWLDLVRYADTSGCNSDYPMPDAYRYRNWVIQAFNDDKPYDRFLREQIAGDLLPDAGKDGIIATGYLAIARRFGSRNNEFHLTIEDTIDNVGKTMLGLSVACARCHDHKFDPIPSRDYYAMYGIFQSTKYAFPGTEIYHHAKDFTPLVDGADAARLIAYQKDTSQIDERVEDVMAGRVGKDWGEAEKQKEYQALRERMAVLEKNFPAVPKAYAVSEGTPANARVQRKGEPKNLAEEVPRGFLTILGGAKLPPEEKGSGRRELADWIMDNPLMARVMVNRIWQYHFGKGIVGTPSDFGARGDRPVNPELLDYLAARFKESGYSVKAMHKRMMLTRAYRLASDGANYPGDPKNLYQWKFDRRRLDAEEIRDAILAVAGDLDPKMGGPHPFPAETSFQYTQHQQFFAVYDNRQRSVYLMQQRQRKQAWLDTFDGADPNASTPKRSPGETSLQALAMLNSSFLNEQANVLAARAAAASSTEKGRIGYAYGLLFGRAPAADEVRDCVKFLADARAEMRDGALAGLMHVLLASDEFLFVD
ncbi:MAG TPA: PSD1 and planctomycete cytochrome C domain-containing protein [Bryobacteraceae bacterium]|jgi:hypothetical protein|nr:PSD1 and planctomycete cytochrome C domain-containing protein [Bryobacteraceae bacterium]